MLNNLKNINNKLIDIYYKDPTNLKKQLIIKQLLNTPNIFNYIPIEYSYSILKDLGIPQESIKDVYTYIISIKGDIYE